jgi:hypothetical protein
VYKGTYRGVPVAIKKQTISEENPEKYLMTELGILQYVLPVIARGRVKGLLLNLQWSQAQELDEVLRSCNRQKGDFYRH